MKASTCTSACMYLLYVCALTNMTKALDKPHHARGHCAQPWRYIGSGTALKRVSTTNPMHAWSCSLYPAYQLHVAVSSCAAIRSMPPCASVHTWKEHAALHVLTSTRMAFAVLAKEDGGNPFRCKHMQANSNSRALAAAFLTSL
jgi:hypothetical protein